MMNVKRRGSMKSAGPVIVLAVGLAAGIGCGNKAGKETARPAAEKNLSDMVAQATDGRARVDLKNGRIEVKTPDGGGTITLGGGAWPIDIPEDISRFRPGSIRGTSNADTPDGKTWTIVVDGVEAGDVRSYIGELNDDGWPTTSAVEVPEGKFTRLQRGKSSIQLTFAGDEKTLTIHILRARGD